MPKYPNNNYTYLGSVSGSQVTLVLLPQYERNCHDAAKRLNRLGLPAGATESPLTLIVFIHHSP